MRSLSASADLHKGMNRVPSLQQPRQQREPEPAVPLRPIDLCCGVNHTAVAADNAMALELWPDALFFVRPNHLGTEPTPYTRASSRETRLGLGFPCSVQFARGGRGLACVAGNTASKVSNTQLCKTVFMLASQILIACKRGNMSLQIGSKWQTAAAEVVKEPPLQGVFQTIS
ncbi:hypothetical protein C0Q70_00796 [Pomacea canaliculata]|uniref:Uncharacterized protein n=1 Tax=Pomacea canaliculata TaxID=400727 RepID=A0A2T7PXN2_POMCA|nr:hypothetical protein C0Q70_00796 [Pomacea canaliculata]